MSCIILDFSHKKKLKETMASFHNATFTPCLKVLGEADKCMKEYLFEEDYQKIILSYKKNKVAIFIDVDFARADKGFSIRGQLYEAAELFKKNGGEIYAITSQPKAYFDHGNYLAFTDIFTVDNSINKDGKVNIIMKHDTWFKHDYDLYIFGDDKMYSSLLQYKGSIGGNIICNVTGTTFLELYNNHSPYLHYTVVEYILFYLSIKLHMKNIEIGVIWE